MLILFFKCYIINKNLCDGEDVRVKNLIVNIYKTLFFFDLSIVIVYYLPDIKTKNAALLNLWRDGMFFAVMLIFTLFFKTAVERNRLKIFNPKNKLRHYSIGLITGLVPVAITLLLLMLIRKVKFSGINHPGHTLLWLAAIFFNVFATELLLRGYLFRLYRKYYGFTVTAVIITLLFISMNPGILKHGVIYPVNMLLNNLIFCLIAEYSYSLLAPVVAHFAYNAVSSLVAGSMSLYAENPFLLKLTFSGNKYISGGAMKLEGSAVMLVCQLAVCAFFILRLKKRRQ